MNQKAFFKNISFIGAILALVISCAFFVMKDWKFGAGVLVGFAWIYVNSYFLFKLFHMSFETKVKASDKILLISILKFPVLYVAGFFILKSRVFPVYSILTGLTIYFLSFVAAWIKLNFSAEVRAEGSR